jgi:hypothetical protein
MAIPEPHIKNMHTLQTFHNECADVQKKRITAHVMLTYFRIVLGQEATLEIQHPFLHRERIRVPSQRVVRLSKVTHLDA